jgi:hypothetical protein
MERWSSQWNWAARSRAWDAEKARVETEAEKAEIKRVMALRYSTMQGRLDELNAMAEKFSEWFKDETKVWLEETEEIQTDNATILKHKIRFNAALIDQFRGAMDDSAKETGGRIRKSELRVTELPKQYIGMDFLEEIDLEEENGDGDSD